MTSHAHCLCVLQLATPVTYHVMHKDVDPVEENDAVYEPSDVDYRFCAKVWRTVWAKVLAIFRHGSENVLGQGFGHSAIRDALGLWASAPRFGGRFGPRFRLFCAEVWGCSCALGLCAKVLGAI